MNRKTISVNDSVTEYINEWRAKCLRVGTEKSFSQCVNEMLNEMVRIARNNQKKKKTVYVVWYDDDYGSIATETRRIDGVYDTEIKAKQRVTEGLRQFYKEYPNLKHRKPYDIEEWDVY